MNLINCITLDVKKSKFVSYYYDVDNINEVDIILDKLRKEHKKAVHFPYAYKINSLVKKSDDKEPSGTAGLPIYNILEKNQLNNRLIIVVRYFGGTKLGTGGLFRAYSKSACDLIKKLKIKF